MPATDNQSSFLSRISIRRNEVAIDSPEDAEIFQKHVSDSFSSLLPSSGDSPAENILSIAWFRKLLDVFLCCEAEFKAVLIAESTDQVQLTKPPLDRLVPELLDRVIKVLDICNAVTQGLEVVHHWQRLTQICVSALQNRPYREGQMKRAKKALDTLLTSMTFDDKENTSHHHAKPADRNWSFGRRGSNLPASKDRTSGSFRSMSFGVAKSWSASKQIHAMSANLVLPRGTEHTGLVLPVYIMSTVMVFMSWALVAAIPCQERAGLLTHFPVPKQLGWAQPVIGLQEKIGEEWKKKEKKGTSGLLEEIHRMEKVSLLLSEFADAFEYPMQEEKEDEVARMVLELTEICNKMEEGLGPFQQQVREVFHRIVRSRAEILEVIDQIGKSCAPVPY